MESKAVFGYLREHTSKCPQSGCKFAYTGLDTYLSAIFPEVSDWIHNKGIPGAVVNGRPFRRRPDYRSESLNLVIEFDGLQHYQNPLKIVSDAASTDEYASLGYRVARIPYFIQLTNSAAETLFGVNAPIPLFDGSMPSLGLEWRNTPAFLCPLGVRRMAREFMAFPDQLDVNLHALAAIPDRRLSGLDELDVELKSIAGLSV